MNYRTRMALAFLVVALTPVVATGLLVRHETTRWLTTQFEERARAVSASVTDALTMESERVNDALAAVAEDARADNDLRVALIAADFGSQYLIDYAPQTMRRTPLDVLMLLADDDRVISSGHFRNEFGRDLRGVTEELKVDGTVVDATVVDGAATLFLVKTPESELLALVRPMPLRVGDVSTTLVGGARIDSAYLRDMSNDPELTVRLSGLPDGEARQSIEGAANAVVDGVSFRTALRFVDASGVEVSSSRVWIEVTHDASSLRDLLADLNQWFLVMLGVAAVGALAAALWFADRMSRPIVDLADRARRIDIQRSGDIFLMRRNDEIGQLSRRLGEMVKRLRESAGSLQAAERRATLGDMARQVNHDVRNGLTPIKNVVRHLSELSENDPTAVAQVFSERRRTLESSITYLEELASRYAKLSPQARREACDLSAIARQVVDDFRASGLRSVTLKRGASAPIDGDPIALRRMVENLVRNALESADDRPVDVVVAVSNEKGSGGVTLTVSDNGPGIPDETRERMFDDFYTTKPTGTGLGLSIVRRVAIDHNGKIAVMCGPEGGTTFSIVFAQME